MAQTDPAQGTAQPCPILWALLRQAPANLGMARPGRDGRHDPFYISTDSSLVRHLTSTRVFV